MRRLSAAEVSRRLAADDAAAEAAADAQGATAQQAGAERRPGSTAHRHEDHGGTECEGAEQLMHLLQRPVSPSSSVECRL